MNIENKVVLITGASRGIGQAPGHRSHSAKRGARRVYAGTRRPLSNTDRRVTPLALDVTNASQIQQAAFEVGHLDVLVNNAGVAVYDDLSNPDVIERHLAVNLFGPLNVTRAFLPQLKRSGGAVLNHLSLAGLAPLPVIPAYSLSKAAALNLTQSLRGLLAGQGRDRPWCLPGTGRHRHEPRLRHPEGIARIRRAGHLRRAGARRSGNLP